MTQQAVALWEKDFTKMSESDNFVNSPDFTPPIYNVWKRQTKTNTVDHFGNSEPTWLENLLYLYTDPADIVVDPFAGSGSTIVVCKKRQRRYWVSDFGRSKARSSSHNLELHRGPPVSSNVIKCRSNSSGSRYPAFTRPYPTAPNRSSALSRRCANAQRDSPSLPSRIAVARSSAALRANRESASSSATPIRRPIDAGMLPCRKPPIRPFSRWTNCKPVAVAVISSLVPCVIAKSGS